MTNTSRRGFLQQAAALSAAAVAAGTLSRFSALAADQAGPHISLGLVTYQWGNDWDLPTLIANCTTSKVLGVELRTTHAHKVEPTLNDAERAEVKQRFADSPVTLVGLGSAEDFHRPDPAALKKSIENTKAFIRLSHDVGGSGVKVRPNDLPKGIPQEQTIEQIGRALNVVGAYGADYGQQIRLEVHGGGGCAKLPIIKQIMDVATHPNVAVCWNSNGDDLEQPGLEHNFNLVQARLGATTHVKPVNTRGYPFPELMKLCLKVNYRGWWLLEAGDRPEDRVKALADQKVLFDELLAKAKSEL